MQKRPWSLAVSSFAFAAWLVASAASALPSGPIVSGNGQLEFSNFQFFSPGGSVGEDEVTVNVLADGISLSGPIDLKYGAAAFFVTYDVRALGAPIVTASLELDAEPIGFVLSTKRIIGDRGDPCDWWGDHDGKGGWFGGHPGKGKGGWFDDREGKDRWGKWDADGDRFERGGKKHRGGKGGYEIDPFGRRPLAFLRTMQIDGSGNFLVAASFAPQESLRVIEHVVMAGPKGAAWNASINRFTVVPEPATAALTLLGLGLFALRPQRRR